MARHWTTTEIQLLEEMTKAGKPQKEIAFRLNRSLSSIRMQVYIHRHTYESPWAKRKEKTRE